MNITYTTAFADNYIWFLHLSDKQVAVIDPGDTAPVLDYLDQQQLEPAAIFLTHHHQDHVGGVDELLQRFSLDVYDHSNTSDGELIGSLPGDCEVEVWHTPGHTKDHISFLSEDNLFCGDTLFSAGCGGLFGGTAEELFHSLNRINDLPSETNIYCAHEYTLENLQFASVAEPDNRAIIRRISDTNELRKNGRATVPSTLQLEKETNPFLRYSQPQLIAGVEQFVNKTLDSEVAIFRSLRKWKDHLDRIGY